MFMDLKKRINIVKNIYTIILIAIPMSFSMIDIDKTIDAYTNFNN